MLDFVSKDHYTVYPMLDNVTQPNIVNVGYQALPAVLVGQASVTQATGELAAQAQPTAGQPARLLRGVFQIVVR